MTIFLKCNNDLDKPVHEENVLKSVFHHMHFNLARNPMKVVIIATTLLALCQNVQFTMNGMCTKNNTLYMWRKQAIIESSRWVNSIIVCCHSVKLRLHAARDFWSQQNGAVTRMWRSCRVQPSHKERTIGAVHSKKEGMLLQPLNWRCTEMSNSPRTEYARRTTPYICGANKQ